MSNGVEKKVQTKERPYECVTVKPDGKLAWLIVVASFVSVSFLFVTQFDRKHHRSIHLGNQYDY